MATLPGISVGLTVDTTQIETGLRRARRSVEQFDASTGRGSGIRAFRGGLGQLGLQLQDIIVQLQAGTSGAIVFAQQGSQIAGAFGPAGAAIGVVLAGVGALATAFLTSRDAAAEAAKSYEKLVGIMDKLHGQTELSTEALQAAARNLVVLQELDVSKLERQLQEMRDSGIGALPLGAAQIQDLEQELEAAKDELTLFRAEAGEFGGEASAAAQSVTKEVDKLRDATESAGREFIKLQEGVDGLASRMKGLADNPFVDFKQITDEELGRRTGQLSAGGLSATDVSDDVKKAQQEADRAAQQAIDRQKSLNKQREETIAGLSIENDQQAALSRAYQQGAKAVREQEIAIESANIARRLELKAGSEQAKQIEAEVARRRKLADVLALQREEEEKLFATYKEMNDEELKRRTGQASAGGLSAPGLPEEEELSEPFKNALQDVQSEFTTVFEEISRSTIRSFEDMAQAGNDIFTNMSANIASLAIFDPEAFDKLAAQTATTTGLSPGTSGGLLAGSAFATPAIGLLNGLFGNQSSQKFGMIGGGAGATAGGLLGLALSGGNPAGAAIGSLAGGLLGNIGGGIFGGLFGDDDEDKTVGSFSGGIGRASFTGDSQISSFVKKIDDSILGFLDSRQKSIAQKLESSGRLSVKGGLSAADFETIGSERIGAVASALGFNRGAILRGDADQSLQNLQRAVQLQQTLDDLTSSASPFIRQMEDVNAQFREARIQAKEFGIATSGLRKAQREAIDEIRRAREETRRQTDAQIASLLDPFDALSDPLKALQTELEFGQLNPADQLAKARAEFDRVSGLAEGGDVAALSQLQGASQLLIDLAERFGASPGGAAAREDVADAIATALDRIEEARKEAESSIQDEVRRASREQIAVLRDIVESVDRAAAEIRRSSKRVGT